MVLICMQIEKQDRGLLVYFNIMYGNRLDDQNDARPYGIESSCNQKSSDGKSPGFVQFSPREP
jgi:hypothetical protein